MTLQLIAAKAKNNVIGSGPDIPWHAKGEQKLFKEITLGGALIMGRITFESIGRPLPGRDTIIVSRKSEYQQLGCYVASDLYSAIAQAKQLKKPVFIAGGGNIYAQALPLVDEIHLTTIDIEPEGDVFFPEFDIAEFSIEHERQFTTNLTYTYQHLIRL